MLAVLWKSLIQLRGIKFAVLQEMFTGWRGKEFSMKPKSTKLTAFGIQKV